MGSGYFINAICTPLSEDESVHSEGLEAHIADQFEHGIEGVLVGGTMGMMQLLRDSTYRELVQQSVELSAGKGEVLVGVGDTSYSRTKERLEFVNQFDIDGVVVLAPFFILPTATQLVDYYKAVADVAKAPVYLYDLPAITRVDFSMDTYLELQEHPNIHGAKISGRFAFTRQVRDQLDPEFRVIIAEPEITDVLLRAGFQELLDGIYSIAPHWLQALRDAAAVEDWDVAAEYQQRITRLRTMLTRFGNVMATCSALLNIHGIPGKTHFSPSPALTDEQVAELLQDPVGEAFAASSSKND
jgi:4-hydroxy-tetrahydrodipicolinate synthase